MQHLFAFVGDTAAVLQGGDQRPQGGRASAAGRDSDMILQGQSKVSSTPAGGAAAADQLSQKKNIYLHGQTESLCFRN